MIAQGWRYEKKNSVRQIYYGELEPAFHVARTAGRSRVTLRRTAPPAKPKDPDASASNRADGRAALGEIEHLITEGSEVLEGFVDDRAEALSDVRLELDALYHAARLAGLQGMRALGIGVMGTEIHEASPRLLREFSADLRNVVHRHLTRSFDTMNEHEFLQWVDAKPQATHMIRQEPHLPGVLAPDEFQ
jgi:hypothetical protein